MIKQSTVLAATPIAQEATAKGISLYDKCSDIIKGLDETTSNLSGFTLDNIATDLPEYTALVNEHTEALDIVTTVMANSIRTALEGVSKYVKPMLKEIENNIASKISPRNALDTIFTYLDVTAVNIEPGIFNSAFYPATFPQGWDYRSTVKRADIFKGVWPTKTSDELLTLIKVNVKELETFFEDPEEIKEVYESFFIDKDSFSIFNSENAETFSFSGLNGFRFGNFRRLMILSLIVNRLCSDDEPMPGVSSVSLDDYRSSLMMLKDALSTSLYLFKRTWAERAKNGIAIIHNGVSYGSDDGLYNFMKDKPVLRGEIQIGYNQAILELFSNDSEISLSEFIVGYLYAKEREYPIKDFITDKDVIVNAFKEYLADVKTYIHDGKQEIAYKATVETINSFYSNEAYRPIIDAITSPLAPPVRILNGISKTIDLKSLFDFTEFVDKLANKETSLMNTVMSYTLADVLGYPIAKEILFESVAIPDDSIESQRKNLSIAIDKVIIKRLVNC